MQSLTTCAEEVGVALSVAKPLESYEIPPNHAGGVRLGINGEHQSTNAALALALCDAFQRADATPPPNVAALVSGSSTLTAASLEGLGACHWPGRGQIERQVAGQEDNVVFYLDGAHTQESMACCSRWYHDCGQARACRRCALGGTAGDGTIPPEALQVLWTPGF